MDGVKTSQAPPRPLPLVFKDAVTDARNGSEAAGRQVEGARDGKVGREGGEGGAGWKGETEGSLWMRGRR